MSSFSTMNIALPEPMWTCVAERVTGGQYGSACECVQELIRRDQREHERLRLSALVAEGLARGPATRLTTADWVELAGIADGNAA